ncbi:UDP glycosyltransferase [Catellatospora sp. TT07R-123]|uniref:macrolide family glycosyltransferase n=1 Tax=Catellatospora sp. TT07R-123 TaxID=2733863 RepID=UPI001B087B28|nr:macrolide family glycosyltransferase [Catellatospora sp. TT07R-123]GHJ45337.1 UDP glycosyltransferase [Catellatospora sp. TT07R-123]
MTWHIAFLNAPTIGEVFPTLAIVAELVRRGHRVSYATGQARAEVVTAMGATVVPYESSLPDESDPGLLPPRPVDYFNTMRGGFLREARTTFPQFECLCLADRPDLLVYHTQAFAARMLAVKHRIPAVQLWTFMAANPQWSIGKHLGLAAAGQAGLDEHQRRLDALATEQGCDPEEVRAYEPRRHLMLYPRLMQFRHLNFDGRYRFVGPCVGERPFQQPWQPPEPDRPVALVSLGTVYNRLPGFYRTCVDAFAGTDWQVVLSLGSRTDPAEVGPVPPNVHVAESVPQLQVLRHARVFVTHAGMGGSLEALRAGVPMLTLPQTPEQQVNALRLAELGAARPLDPALLTPAYLRGAADAVAGDAAMRHKLHRLSHEVRACGGATLAADLIEAELPVPVA